MWHQKMHVGPWGTGNKYIIRHGLRVICIYDYVTYELHTLHRHPGSGYSQQYDCHRDSQLVWTHIQCKQHHPEL